MARGGPAILRLTQRGKRVAAVLALVAALALMAGGFGLGAATAGERLVPTQSGVVGAGDTLWSIAREWSGPGADVRDLVAEIRQLNRLSSSQLVVGEVLEVPRR
jgi:hypothetical protein